MPFLKDGPVSKHVLMSHRGAINSLDSNKSNLDFTTMDPGTADDMAAAIRFRNSRFMNISVIGDVRQASNGALTLLMSGDRTIKVEHEPILACISSNLHYLGSAGTAAAAGAIIQSFQATTTAALAETLTMADRCMFRKDSMMEIRRLTGMLSPLLNEKGTNIIQEMYHHGTKIDNALTMIQTAISIANEKSQPIPIKSMTNDILKGANLSRQESIDISSN